jgi:hypothetical protein
MNSHTKAIQFHRKLELPMNISTSTIIDFSTGYFELKNNNQSPSRHHALPDKHCKNENKLAIVK